MFCVFFFQAEDGIRDIGVTGVQTCALPILAVEEPHSFVAGTVSVHNCIGNSGPLISAVSEGIAQEQLVVAAVDRKSVVEGKGVDVGGGGISQKKRAVQSELEVVVVGR